MVAVSLKKDGGGGAVVGRRLTMRSFFQAEDGIRDVERSRGLGDVYKRQAEKRPVPLLACQIFMLTCQIFFFDSHIHYGRIFFKNLLII